MLPLMRAGLSHLGAIKAIGTYFKESSFAGIAEPRLQERQNQAARTANGMLSMSALIDIAAYPNVQVLMPKS
jgi:hypothetical protein